MAANITDKFTEATNGTRPDNAALTAQKSIGAASITVDSTAGWGTATAVHFVIYQIDASGARVANTQTEWKGIVSSSTSITSLTLKAGTDQVYPVGSKVIATPTAAAWDDLVEGVLEFANQDGSLITQAVRDALGLTSGETSGWETLGYAPNTITALGNRSYTVVVNSVDLTATTSVGMRLKLPRTVTAPTQSANLNGTTQYFSKSSPSGMTFIDDFVVSAWVKLSSYAQGGIASRFDSNSGWLFWVDSTGQVILQGNNANAANYSRVRSYQSIPLNKWVHISAQLDMSAFTATTTTSYVMIDGKDVPANVERAGTNPTALVQAGNQNIGAWNGGTAPFPGKIAQVAIYSAKVTQATILASMNQTLTGSETSLVSAYTFNNSINDLSANANNLTPQGSAVATNADTPFTNPVTGTSVTAGTTNYGIIMAQTFSTNTTYTIQIPEGETLPTTGGIGTVSYSTQKTPYGFVSDESKWTLATISRGSNINNGASTGDTYYNVGSMSLSVPAGVYKLTANINVQATMGSATSHGAAAAIGTTAGNSKDVAQATGGYSASADVRASCYMDAFVRPTTATTYYINIASIDQNATNLYIVGATQDCILTAECVYV